MLGAVPGCGLVAMIDIFPDPVIGIEYVGVVSLKFGGGKKYGGYGVSGGVLGIV